MQVRKFLRNFCIIFILISGIIILIPVNERDKYLGMEDDCFNHGIWIFDRIHNNSKPIDIAILGSSHTLNSIDDKMLSERMDGMQVANLAYCRLGRNMSYILLKEVLETKTPKLLLLEVRENEDRYSHPIFPYIARTRDVLLPSVFFNRDILIDIGTHFTFKYEIMQNIIFKRGQSGQIRTNDFGFSPVHDTAATETLENIRHRSTTKKPELSDLQRRFHVSYPRSYLKKIAGICEKNNIALCYIYLPRYASPYEFPNEYRIYSEHGTLLIPPKSILDKEDFWYDRGHLNYAGSQGLSTWLAEEMLQYLNSTY